MYRVNPLTYVVEGFLASTLSNAPVSCADSEVSRFDAPNGSTCSEYMADYMHSAGGFLVDDSGDTSECQFCPLKDTNVFLSSLNSDFSHRWRNFGFLWAYIIFNIAAAFFFYWLARVPKKSKAKKE